jgi:hypothetical protein
MLDPDLEQDLNSEDYPDLYLIPDAEPVPIPNVRDPDSDPIHNWSLTS